MKPQVSVIIPSYNHASYIARAITSVLNQSYGDLELIVVDDGSLDNSIEIIRAFQDPRIRLFTQSNSGAHVALNRGMAESRGRYIAILNSDDFYHLRRLEVMIAAMEAEKATFASSYLEIVDGSDQVIARKKGWQNARPWDSPTFPRGIGAIDAFAANLIFTNYIATTSNIIFLRELLERHGDMKPYRYAHDWDFALRIALHEKCIEVPEFLLAYRVHSTNTIKESGLEMWLDILQIWKEHLPRFLANLGDPQVDFLRLEEWFCSHPLARVAWLNREPLNVLDRKSARLLIENLSPQMRPTLRHSKWRRILDYLKI